MSRYDEKCILAVLSLKSVQSCGCVCLCLKIESENNIFHDSVLCFYFVLLPSEQNRKDQFCKGFVLKNMHANKKDRSQGKLIKMSSNKVNTIILFEANFFIVIIIPWWHNSADTLWSNPCLTFSLVSRRTRGRTAELHSYTWHISKQFLGVRTLQKNNKCQSLNSNNRP